ncbi:MAG: ankyrin repeat domain-containing protein, partial [Luteolibacter sp.]
QDSLFLAVANRRSSNVRILLAHGANPNGKDARGNTILMASFQGRRPDKEIIRLLLSAGADTQTKDPTGLAAKDFAATFHDPELLALLP